MATGSYSPKGSWILKGLIVLAAIFLLSSILYPKKLWQKQADLITDSRERMENLDFVARRFKSVKGFHQPNIDSLVAFIESDSILVDAPLFENEALHHYGAPNDSFLIGFLDRYHFDRLDLERISPDSVLIIMYPKDVFADVIQPAKRAFYSDKGVDAFARGKGEDDIYWIVSSRSKMVFADLAYDSSLVPSTDYVLYRDVNDITIDPITNNPFVIDLNIRLTVEGIVNYLVDPQGDPEFPIADNKLISNLLLNKMARQARAQVDAHLKRDTTAFDAQLQLQSDYFDAERLKMRPGKTVSIDGDREINIPVDSVDHYSDPAVIKTALFNTVYDSLIRAWEGETNTVSLFAEVSFVEDYSVSKIDTTGLTIHPPFGTEHTLESETLIEKVFSVGPVKNPGYIENSDLSWSEKK